MTHGSIIEKDYGDLESDDAFFFLLFSLESWCMFRRHGVAIHQ